MIETLPQSEAATTATTTTPADVSVHDLAPDLPPGTAYWTPESADPTPDVPRYVLVIPADDWDAERKTAEAYGTPWPTAGFKAKWEHAVRLAGLEPDPERPTLTFEIDRFAGDLRIEGPVRYATTQAAGDPLTPEERQSLTIWGETIGAQSRVYADVDDDLKVTGRYRVLVLHVKDDAPRSAAVELPPGDVAKLRALIEAADARPLV
jgi:hypothetical protein